MAARRFLFLSVSLSATLALGCGARSASYAPAAPPQEAEHAVSYDAGDAVPSSARVSSRAAPEHLAGAPASAGPAPVAAKTRELDHAGAKDTTPESTLMLVFTGQLQMLVEADALARTIDRVVDIAARAGGHVGKQDDHQVTVRVPSARFREAMQAMEGLGEVSHRTVHSEDVTEEFHDLEVRLKSLRATQARIQELMARATSIQEILVVEEQLARINGEIDRIRGRMRFLASRASLSTITVALEAKPKPVPVAVEEPKAPPPPPPPRTIPMPIGWLPAVGIDKLLELR